MSELYTFRTCKACAGTGSVDRDYDEGGGLRSWQPCQACGGSGAVKVPLDPNPPVNR